MTKFCQILSVFAASAAILAATVDARAATGTIGNHPGASGVYQPKTSNISGPSVAHNGVASNFTATFGNLTNTSGSITADLLPPGGGEYLCTATFQTTVVKGSCNIIFSNNPGGQGGVCSTTVVSKDPTTCNFSVSFSDLYN